MTPALSSPSIIVPATTGRLVAVAPQNDPDSPGQDAAS